MSAPKEINHYDVARLYWSLPQKERNFREVARMLGLEDDKKIQNELSARVRDWEDSGKVQHVVLQERPDEVYLPLIPALEDGIRRLYGLRDVVVVDTSGLRRPDVDPSSDQDSWDELDDRIHEHLGVWAARVLVSVVRPGDIVGVGSGRGPYYTANECKIPPTSAFYPKGVTSLTGKMTARDWGKGAHRRDKVRSMDADFIASLLVTGLGANLPAKTINLDITEKLSGKPIREGVASNVRVALIGIGALGGGHRLRHHEDFDELKPVRAELNDLNRKATQADNPKRARPPFLPKGPFLHWVGDVCNSLFVVDGHVGRNTLPADKRKGLEELARRINNRFVNTKPQSLTEICKEGAVIAVAGGPHKFAAIAHVIRQRKPWITHLITDDQTAGLLVNSDLFRDVDLDKEMIS